MRSMRTALEIVFWVSAVLIAWTQVGYAFAVGVAGSLGRAGAKSRGGGREARTESSQIKACR